MRNPIFSHTIGRFLWKGLKEDATTLTDDKFSKILTQLSLISIVVSFGLGMVVPQGLFYLLWFIPQEYLIVRLTSSLFDRWVSLLYLCFFIPLGIWYIQPLFLLPFSQTILDVLFVLFCTLTWFIHQFYLVIVPPIFIVVTVLFTFFTLILGASPWNCLRLIQVGIWYLIFYKNEL